MTNNSETSGALQALDTMFGQSKQLINKLSDPQVKGKLVRVQDLKFALTVLLVQLALADNDFDQNEFGVISKALRDMFETTPEEVKALVAQAKSHLSNFRSTETFCKQIVAGLDKNDREKIMEVIAAVIRADGAVQGFEAFYENKYKAMLGL